MEYGRPLSTTSRPRRPPSEASPGASSAEGGDGGVVVGLAADAGYEL